MKLLNLTARNIFSIGEVSLNLKDRGLTLVTGWSYDDNNGNMAGKSNIASRVISWGLYGKTVDGIRADSVISTSSKHKPSEVIIYFDGNDGSRYRIKRSRNPNRLTLYCGQVDITKRIDTETQELINKALGRDHKTFIQSDFFGQGRERSFLSLAGSEQRAVIEEILPLTSLDRWYESAKEYTVEIDAKVTDTKLELRLSEERITSHSNRLEDVKTQYNNWGSNRQREVSAARVRLSDLESVHFNLKDELFSLKDSLPTSISIPEFLKEQQKLKESLTSRIDTISVKLPILNILIRNLKEQPDTCTACLQKLPEEIVERNEKLVAEHETEHKQLSTERDSCTGRRCNVEEAIETCEEALEVESKINSKTEEAILKEHIQLKEVEQNPFQFLLDSTQEELGSEKETKKQHYITLSKHITVQAHYKFWENAFGKDLKTILFNQVCPYLEEKANQYLRELNNGQIKVKFSTVKEMKSGDTKDEFCVTASSDTGSSIFELFSGAEKQLTSFAVGMALSDLASMQTEGASQFMILDEPFLYQSPENCENIVSFITQRLGGKSTILLISNEENLVNLISNRVHVVKRNGVSSIE